MAFTAFQPSDAMLQALQARLGRGCAAPASSSSAAPKDIRSDCQIASYSLLGGGGEYGRTADATCPRFSVAASEAQCSHAFHTSASSGALPISGTNMISAQTEAVSVAKPVPKSNSDNHISVRGSLGPRPQANASSASVPVRGKRCARGADEQQGGPPRLHVPETLEHAQLDLAANIQALLSGTPPLHQLDRHPFNQLQNSTASQSRPSSVTSCVSLPDSSALAQSAARPPTSALRHSDLEVLATPGACSSRSPVADHVVDSVAASPFLADAENFLVEVTGALAPPPPACGTLRPSTGSSNNTSRGRNKQPLPRPPIDSTSILGDKLDSAAVFSMDGEPAGPPPQAIASLLEKRLVGGFPVQSGPGGDMVYLGGGLYAHATRQEQAAKFKPDRNKVLPGRVAPLAAPSPRPPARPQAKPRSGSTLRNVGERIASPQEPQARRSQSSRSCPGNVGDDAPRASGAPLPRTKSNGHLAQPSELAFAGYPGAGRTASTGSSARVVNSSSSEPPLASARPLPEGPLGRHSDERSDVKRQVLAREYQEPPIAPPQAPPEGHLGRHSDQRYAARRQAREARLQAAEEARERVESDHHVDKPLLRRGNVAASSAPHLRPPPPQPRPAAPTREDIEQQKIRLASKMEQLGFLEGYSKNIAKITSEQTKVLRSKMRGCDELAVASVVEHCGKQRGMQMQEWSDKAEQSQASMKHHLKIVDDFVSKNFGLVA